MKAARVTLDYDGVYGLTSGPWTTDRFLETAYKEMSALAAKNRLSSRAAPRAAPAPASGADRRGRDRKAPATARRTEQRTLRRRLGAQHVQVPVRPVEHHALSPRDDAGIRRRAASRTRRRPGVAPAATTRRWRARPTRRSWTARNIPVVASSAKVVFKRVDANTIERTARRRPQRHRDRDLDDLLRSQGADDRHQGQGRRRDRLQQHAGLRSALTTGPASAGHYIRTRRRSVRL